MGLDSNTLVYTDKEKLEDVFERFDNHRASIKSRVEEYAHFTLPYIYPTASEKTTKSEELAMPAGSVGARAVNHLSNRMATALFQPGTPFFKLSVDDSGYEYAKEAVGMTEADVDVFLANLERECMKRIDAVNHRTQSVLALKNLIITGNCLLHYNEDLTKVVVYSFSDYTLRRDNNGDVTDIVIKETVNTAMLSDEVNTALETSGRKTPGKHKDVSLYTNLKRTKKDKDIMWKVRQDVEDTRIDISNGLEAEYKDADLPWIALAWNLVRGEDYGRGLVEDYAYSFHAHEVLSSAQMQMAAIMSDRKWFVEPGAANPSQIRNIAQSPPMSWHSLAKDSVWTAQLDTSDLVVLDTTIQRIERELAQAFLLNSAAVRDAERVTAEEIRMQVYELETSHGGVYSRLGMEWQRPAATLVLNYVGSEDFATLPGLTIDIVTGVETLSRMGELESTRALLTDMAGIGSMPPTVLEFIKQDELWKVLGSKHGVSITKFIKTEDEVNAERQAAADAEQMRQKDLASHQAIVAQASQME